MTRPRKPPPKKGGDLVVLRNEPWDRRHGETAKQFQAFAIYRDLTPNIRSIEKTAEILGKSSRTLQPWSSANDWVERAQAYDVEMDRRARQAREDERAAFERRQVAAGAGLSTLGMRRILGDEREGIEPAKPEELDTMTAARLIEIGVRIERLARGMPTDLTKDLDKLTAEEASAIIREVVAAAAARIPEEEHEAFLLEVRAIGARRTA
jgi:hypothetical protein